MLPEVRDMLIADKIQNYKDFLFYHKGTHPRSRELEEYFKNWFGILGIDFVAVARLVYPDDELGILVDHMMSDKHHPDRESWDEVKVGDHLWVTNNQEMAMVRCIKKSEDEVCVVGKEFGKWKWACTQTFAIYSNELPFVTSKSNSMVLFLTKDKALESIA